MRPNAICNKCGRVFDEWDENLNFHISNYMTYGSKYDDDVVEIDLCIKCADELIDSLAISPITNPPERPAKETDE